LTNKFFGEARSQELLNKVNLNKIFIFKIKFKNTIKYIGKEFNGKLKLKMIVEICLLFI